MGSSSFPLWAKRKGPLQLRGDKTDSRLLGHEDGSNICRVLEQLKIGSGSASRYLAYTSCSSSYVSVQASPKQKTTKMWASFSLLTLSVV